MVCMAIDSLKELEVLGTIAGDDTALIVFDCDESAIKFVHRMKEIIGL